MTDMGIWGQSPQPPEARGSTLPSSSVWRILQFLMKLTRFLAYLGLNFSFKLFY